MSLWVAIPFGSWCWQYEGESNPAERVAVGTRMMEITDITHRHIYTVLFSVGVCVRVWPVDLFTYIDSGLSSYAASLYGRLCWREVECERQGQNDPDEREPTYKNPHKKQESTTIIHRVKD